MVSVRTLLLNHRKKASAAGNIDPTACGVILHIVGIVDAWDAGDRRSRPGVDCEQLGRGAGLDEQALVLFAQRDRKVVTRPSELPDSDRLTFLEIDDCHSAIIRQVDKEAPGSRFNRETLG